MVKIIKNWRVYLELCKPRVVMLMLLTAVVGMLLASPGWVPWRALVLGTVGIGFGAGSAAAINHLADQYIDAMMNRTQFRPLPSGQLTSREVIIFASVLGIASMLVLGVGVNVMTALLTLITLIGYAGVYTLFLKRATSQNIVIGGLAGAAPPLLGWAAVTGHIDPHALLLVLIIFVWTPPHFWALAIHRYDEYAKAKIPMLPVTHGIPYTKLSILLYTLLLLIVSVLPYTAGMSGLLYLLGATVLGIGFIYWAWRLKYYANTRTAMQTFRYSIFYLMMLFVILLTDHYFFKG